MKKIAGIVARRIICYAKEQKEVQQNEELGFIRFGSRVDLFFPVGTKIHVELGQKTKGTQTIVATY